MKLTVEQAKEKIRKLLAMVNPEAGASQQEMETAAKKARKIMVEMKLSEADVFEKRAPRIRTFHTKEHSFTTTTDFWLDDLMHVVAKNYCCEPVNYKPSGRSTRFPGFCGFEEDAEIALSVFNAAAAVAKAEVKSLLKQREYRGTTSHEKTLIKNAYGRGYARGLEEALEAQNQHEGETFAIALSVPVVVSDHLREISHHVRTVYNASGMRNYDSAAAQGYLDGKEFTKRKAIA